MKIDSILNIKDFRLENLNISNIKINNSNIVKFIRPPGENTR